MIGVDPDKLTFTPGNWETVQTVELEPTSFAEDRLSQAYTITVGVNATETMDHIYDELAGEPTQVSMNLRILGFLEIKDPPTEINEGQDWTEITIALTDSHDDPVTIMFSHLGTTPEPTSLAMVPSNGLLTIEARNTNDHFVSIRYDDDIDSDNSDIQYIFADANTESGNQESFRVRYIDDDTPAIIFDGNSAPQADLGSVQIGETRDLLVRLGTKPSDGGTMLANTVVITVGHTEVVMNDDNTAAVTVNVSPATLRFNGDNWNTDQTIAIYPTTDSTLAITIDNYQLTVATQQHTTGASEYYGLSQTFMMDIKATRFIEILPPTGAREGLWYEIEYSLGEPRSTRTELEFVPVDFGLLPDRDGLMFNSPNGIQSNAIVEVPPGSTTGQRVSIRYDDDFASSERFTPIRVLVHDIADTTGVERTEFTFNVGNDDSTGIVVENGNLENDVVHILQDFRVGREYGIPVRLHSRPEREGEVVLTIDFFPFAGSDDDVLIAINPTLLRFNSFNWNQPQRLEFMSDIAPESELTMALTLDYGFTIGVSDDLTTDTLYRDVSDRPISLTLLTEMFTEEDEASIAAAVAVVDLGAAQFALDAIGGNVPAGEPTGPQLAPSLRLGVSTGSQATNAADPWAQGDGWRDDFVSLWDGGSFRLPLGVEGGTGGFEVWGEGRVLDVSGDKVLDDGSNYTYEGDATGFVLGFGRRGGNLGYGLAVASTKSRVDLAGGSLTVERIDNELLTLLPYVGVSFDARSRAWLVGGVGEGEAELLLSGRLERTDSTVRSLGVGIEHSMEAAGFDLAGRLLASSSQSTLEGTEQVPDLANVKGQGHRLRAEFEAGRDVDVEGAGDGDVFVVAALRRDGGDTGSSTGLEVGGGMRARMFEAYSVEVEGRFQANSSSHEENSVRVRLGYDAGYDGRGLGVGFDEAGGASVGYGWGRSVLGHHGVLSLEVGREGYGEVATTKLGFVSPGLRMSVAGDDDELRADFDLIVLGR